jgi:hypothetical protein
MSVDGLISELHVLQRQPMTAGATQVLLRQKTGGACL